MNITLSNAASKEMRKKSVKKRLKEVILEGCKFDLKKKKQR